MRRLACLGYLNRVVYGCVVRYAVEKQDLVQSQPKQNPNHRSNPVGPRPAKLIDVPVETPLPAHNSVYKLGQKCPVPLIELGVTFQGGPDQPVGMGSLLLDVQKNLISQDA
jgi:hypothetical protein